MELLPEGGCSTRVHRRYRYRVDATFQSGTTVFGAVTENISAGGVFVRTHEPRTIGEVVTLLVPLPPDEPALWATAEVRWIRSAEQGMPAGFGVEFVALDPSSRRAIREVFEV